MVLRQFRVVFNAVKTHFRMVEKAAGVGGAQVWALSLIKQRPGITVTELARSMDIHQSTASNLVRTLVEHQFVAPSKDAHDGRVTTLNLLPDGLNILSKAPAPLTGVLPDALSKLPAETLQRLNEDLAVLITVLDADEEGSNILLSQQLSS